MVVTISQSYRLKSLACGPVQFLLNVLEGWWLFTCEQTGLMTTPAFGPADRDGRHILGSLLDGAVLDLLRASAVRHDDCACICLPWRRTMDCPHSR